MPEGFVNISSYWTPSEAHLAKLCLESHGIDAELENEMLVGTLWNHANAVGGVKLLVKQAEAEQAQSILKSQFEQVSSEESFSPEETTETNDDSSDWQSEGVKDEEGLDEVGHRPQALSRMRPIVKKLIWIQLCLLGAWALVALAILMPVMLLAPAILIAGYYLTRPR